MRPLPEPPRILQYTYGGSHVSGIDNYLLETFRAIDTARVQFDFLFRYEPPFTGEQLEELAGRGARVAALHIEEKQHPILKQAQEAVRLVQFFSKNRYHVIEINMTSTFMCLQTSMIARLFGTRVRIVHAHDAATSESLGKKALKRLAAPLLRASATDYWACAPEAARYLFGEKPVSRGDWSLIRNSIDVSRFEFDPLERRQARSELGLDDAFVVGIIGRVTEQKNHAFALEVFAEAARLRADAQLVVVGDGPLIDQVQRRTDELGLQDRVVFLGSRTDVPRLLSAFDALLAPSHHEGFPIIAIEAQATGVPTLASTAYPETSAIVPGLLVRKSLSDSSQEWASELVALESSDRVNRATQVKTAGYDRESAARDLEKKYSVLVNRKK